MKNQKLNSIIKSIEKAGFEPYAQLTGYLKTGSELYITRTDNARALIREIDLSAIENYLENQRKMRGK